MSADRIKELVSILMESPLYMTLSIKERHSLLVRLEKSYPVLAEEDSMETDAGHDGG